MVSPRSGRISTTPETLTLSVDSASLPAGSYTALIPLEAGGDTGSILVRLYITTVEVGQVLDVKVEQEKGDAWSAGIRLAAPITVSVGVLPAETRFFVSLGRSGLSYSAGEMVLLVKGTVTN